MHYRKMCWKDCQSCWLCTLASVRSKGNCKKRCYRGSDFSWLKWNPLFTSVPVMIGLTPLKAVLFHSAGVLKPKNIFWCSNKASWSKCWKILCSQVQCKEFLGIHQTAENKERSEHRSQNIQIAYALMSLRQNLWKTMKIIVFLSKNCSQFLWLLYFLLEIWGFGEVPIESCVLHS